ncbi:uncharacterized protein SCHCODRAFT_02633454 [Schizophyllum commune H4-8]|uniref:Uncharacterized protein n=1 Tax=Schizophyllum commune (strain H4-8 / FGSC 9210) TaxID=578458 RepID=D8QB82_SCHCM|nr:uncharacterized protein SCHCODRAFT_02633454 [Schizophyllum commune H4-8]KAI5889069.1 hypothetical protein SCHCODRAFT_02633454 [Schizophyllum commune H4-8]
MSSTATAGDMSPKDLMNKDGNYVLQQDNMYAVLQYVWAGVLLPTSPSAFQARLGISSTTMQKLNAVLESLISQYKTTQQHCQPFKDTTYPSIVSIADDVYNYAQNAGGTSTSSYYANIFAAVRALGKTTDPDQIASLKQTITELVNIQVKNIGDITTKAQAVVDDLTDFQNLAMQDSTNLQARHTAVTDALNTEIGNLAQLKQNLSDDRTLLKADQAAYLKDKIIACTTLTYAWIPFVGIIAASVVAGIYGAAAAKLASDIDKTKTDITDDEGKITDETKLIADINSIDADLRSFIAALGAATAAVQGMIGSWGAISGDLTNLQKMVDQDIRTAVGAVANIEDNKLIEKWNDLATAVDKYRQAAYISPIQQQSLDDLSKQVHAQAGN